jgi:hypothetical protein
MTVTHFWNSWNGDARRSLIVAGGLCVALAMATFLGSGGLAAQRTGRAPPAAAGDQNGPLWTLATPLDDGRQMLLVVDQQARALAIYHVDPTNGTLALKSTRDISWDLLVEDFNCQEPRPAALKKMLEMPK